MKAVTIFFLLLLGVTGFSQKKSKYLIAKNYFAGVTPTTTINQLYDLFGIDNVKEDIDYGPEGADSIPVTTVFTGTSKEFVIFWQQGRHHQAPAFVECSQNRAPYHTEQGIQVGTGLAVLLSKNKMPVDFLGFDWDYGGTITSLNKGKLDDNFINYTLNAKGEIPEKMMGDVKLNSEMPLVKKNITKISVARITLHFQ